MNRDIKEHDYSLFHHSDKSASLLRRIHNARRISSQPLHVEQAFGYKVYAPGKIDTSSSLEPNIWGRGVDMGSGVSHAANTTPPSCSRIAVRYCG